MKPVSFLLLVLTLLPLRVTSLEAKAPFPVLDQTALQEAFQILQRDYIRPEALSYEEVNRAAFRGLLEQLGRGAQLVTRNGEEDAKDSRVTFMKAPLGEFAAYLRPARYDPAELDTVDAALAEFESQGRTTLILDLRVPAPESSLEFAARFLDRFVPPDRILFKVQRPAERRPELFISEPQDSRWERETIVLMDSESCRAAELIVAALRNFRPVFVVGAPSPGQTVEYQEIVLTPDHLLRFAIAEILLPDGTSLFQKGLTPDLAVDEELSLKHKVFAASQHSPLGRFVFETSRPRMNEAALVHRMDPELDYFLARSRGEASPFDNLPLQDHTLQRAVDLVTMTREVEP